MKSKTLYLSIYFIAFYANAQEENYKSFNKTNQSFEIHHSLFKKNQSKPSKMLLFEWEDGIWKQKSITYYEYNNLGKISKETNVIYTGSRFVTIYDYYNSGKKRSVIYLYKDPSSLNFDTNYVVNYILDVNGNVEFEIYREFNINGKFINEGKRKNIIQYGLNNRIESFTKQIWNKNKSTFVDEFKYDFTHTNNNIVIGIKFYKYDTSLKSFFPIEDNYNITWHSWNGNGMDLLYSESIALIKNFTKDKFNGLNNEKYLEFFFNYDNFNNTTSDLIKKFNGINYDTLFYNNYNLTYNDKNELVENITQSWNNENKTLNYNRKYEYLDFLTLNATENNKFNNNFISVFPNPSYEKITFINSNSQSFQLKITDLIGNTILIQNYENGKAEVMKDKIGKGIYIYQIVIKDNVISTGKIVFN